MVKAIYYGLITGQLGRSLNLFWHSKTAHRSKLVVMKEKILQSISPEPAALYHLIHTVIDMLSFVRINRCGLVHCYPINEHHLSETVNLKCAGILVIILHMSKTFTAPRISNFPISNLLTITAYQLTKITPLISHLLIWRPQSSASLCGFWVSIYKNSTESKNKHFKTCTVICYYCKIQAHDLVLQR